MMVPPSSPPSLRALEWFVALAFGAMAAAIAAFDDNVVGVACAVIGAAAVALEAMRALGGPSLGLALFGPHLLAMILLVVCWRPSEPRVSVLAIALLAWPLGWVVSSLRQVRLFPSHDAVERVVLRCGACAGLVGAVCLALGGHVAFIALLLGANVLVAVLVRDGRRLAWLARVRDEREAGWRIVPADDLERGENAIAPFVATPALQDALLVRDPDVSTYRGNDRPQLVATLPLDPSAAVAPLRARRLRASLLLAGTIAAGVLALTTTVQRAKALPPPPPAPRAAIECASSGLHLVIEKDLREIPGIQRALFLTHEDSPTTVPEGAGFIYLVAEGGVAARPKLGQNALFAVESIPCDHKLVLELREPVFKRHDIEARLTVAPPGLDAALAAELRESVEAVFAGSDRDIVDHNHADFGLRDKKLAWRVLFALKNAHPRVEKAVLVIDKAGSDALLEATEFPTLGELRLIDVATGKSF
jgi:hypothetical protein